MNWLRHCGKHVSGYGMELGMDFLFQKLCGGGYCLLLVAIHLIQLLELYISREKRPGNGSAQTVSGYDVMEITAAP